MFAFGLLLTVLLYLFLSGASGASESHVPLFLLLYPIALQPLTLERPDELLAALAAYGRDLSRATLEAIALERIANHFSTPQLRRLLGYQTRKEVDGFLEEHGVELEYTVEDLERDREVHCRLGL